MTRALLVTFMLAGPVLLAGCGQEGAGEPEGVAQQFVAAMASGDAASAAELFAYESAAREQNEDWDNMPEAQRGFIIGKLREDKAKELGLWAELFSSAQYEVGEVRITNSTATADLVPPEGPSIPLHLVQEDSLWKVESIGPGKQQRLSRAAVAYLKRKRLGEVSCRFDVVEVMFASDDRVRQIEVIRNAFEPRGIA